MDYIEDRNLGVQEVTIADLRYDFFLLPEICSESAADCVPDPVT